MRAPFVGCRDYTVLGKKLFVGQESGRGSVRESGLFSNTFAMYAQASYSILSKDRAFCRVFESLKSVMPLAARHCYSQPVYLSRRVHGIFRGLFSGGLPC